MEKLFKKKAITAILLNVSVDPNENKNTVMKRLNFYIKYMTSSLEKKMVLYYQ